MNKQSPGGATFLTHGHPMSPLRGLGSWGEQFRGLRPTATFRRRYAAEDMGEPKGWGRAQRTPRLQRRGWLAVLDPSHPLVIGH